VERMRRVARGGTPGGEDALTSSTPA